MSPRVKLVRAVWSGVLCLLLASCARDARDGSGPATLTILYPADEMTMGPAWDEPTKFMVFLPLVEETADGSFTGRLLSRWEASPDYKRYTMHLRPGLRWHDGVPVTAADVQFTLDVLGRPDVGYRTGRVDVIDDTTYTLTLAAPAEGTPDNAWTVYYPRHRLDTLDAANFFEWEFWKQPVGNGPYRYVRHVPKTLMELAANPDYYAGKPRIDRVILKFAENSVAPIVELMSGAVDVAYVRPLDVPKVLQDDRFRAYQAASWNVHIALFWNQRHPALADRRVRRALTHAIDRRTLHQLLGFGADAPLFETPPSRAEFRQGRFQPPLPYDTTAARALLKEAGYGPGGRPLEFSLLVQGGGAEEQTAILLQAQLKRLGVDVRIAPVEWGSFWPRIRDRDYDAAISRAINNAAYIFSYNKLLGSDSPLGFRDPAAARLIEERLSSLDPTVHERVNAELARIILREQPFTILYPSISFTVAHKRVKGLRGPDRTDPAWYAHELWIEE